MLLLSILLFVSGCFLVSWSVAAIVVLVFNLVVYYKTVWLSIKTSRRDLTAGWRYLRSNIALRSIMWRRKTVPMLFQDRVKRHPNKIMFLTSERQWTFQEAEDYSNKLANYFSRRNLKAGDDVALVMENRADVVFIWLALAKIGVATAIINYNLRQSPLSHCVSAVNTKAVVFSPGMAPHILEIVEELKQKGDVKFYAYGGTDLLPQFPAEDILPELDTTPSEPPSYKGSLDDHLLYIYTSGTTGMPKAAVIKHLRYIVCGILIHYMMPLKPSDRMYYYLPLYHMAGGLLGVSQTLLFGLSGAVVPKFSASSFWEDCIKYECTVSQYIGEICRYLHAQPPKATDTQHSIRMMYGNGLRPQLWMDFKNRFQVNNLRELYGSTEGNANIINIDGTVGSVGFVPTICRVSPFLATFIYNLNIVKIDPETGQPVRNKRGLCIRVKPNEPGEIVATINKKPQCRFDGYTDPSATSKKIYRDVFRKGDECFASGDILVFNDDGYLFFKDRTGDTFRWKGENVSTAEVEGVISKHADLNDSVVYGVEIPGLEGKAGMAALLDPDRVVDVNKLLERLRKELPAYALPLFIRITEKLEATGTFKLPKTKLVQEGFNIESFNDPVYFLDPVKRVYVPLEHNVFEKIVNKEMKI